MAQKNTDLDKIKELIEIMKENALIEVEIKHGEDKIFLKRGQGQQSSGAALPTVATNASSGPIEADATQISEAKIQPSVPQQESLVEIKSPIVGTFYATPSPDSAPYVEIGLHVEPQTVVCMVEAMKVMNEIKAETSGTIVEIPVTNGQAVEYGQVLFRVKPD